MPILLLIVIPVLLTACVGPFARERFPLPRLAATIAFLVAIVLSSLFVVSEWRSSYGGWNVAEAILAVLFNSLLVAAFHWSAWSLGLRVWRRVRGVAPPSTRGDR